MPVTENRSFPTDAITFFLNDEKITVRDVAPDKPVLSYLRENQQRTGTKEGCAEGDCGACTVVIAELVADEVVFKNVNSCIQFVPTLDGKALYTVEYLRQEDGSLHPVQQALVDCHASQCGFCTPGFVMSLWNLYVAHQADDDTVSDAQIRSALTGNLCRCTGYRPILEAASRMFDLPRVLFDFDALKNKLVSIRREQSFSYSYLEQAFFAPRSIEDLTALRAEKPAATILSGGTDVGIWVNKQLRELNPMIYVGEVAELKKIEITDSQLRIGAAVSLSDAARVIIKFYPQTAQLWERFASQPIRNVGTLGGNVANGSPIGDSMPALIALESRVLLRSEQDARELAMQDFYLDYMKKDLHANEVLESVIIPLPKAKQQFRCYKLSKRHDSDISAVFAAFAITLNDDSVDDIKIAFGGMAAIPKRADTTEKQIRNQPWNKATINQAMQSLAQDYTPLSDMRATDTNRLQSAQNLLYRFYLETRPEMPLENQSLDVFSAKAEIC